jgi:hypothetical protein
MEKNDELYAIGKKTYNSFIIFYSWKKPYMYTYAR